MANVPYQWDVPLPPGLDKDQRLQVADLIIDEIINRTQNRRIDKNNVPLLKYSKAYADSLEGQIGGKRAGTRANLTLSGDMLASLALIKDRREMLTIGFRKGAPETPRAEGHITGKLGKNEGYKRDFLGLPPRVLARIIREAAGDVKTPGLLELIQAQIARQEPGVS